ncbi:MAG TPA: hypothetical protein VFQ63_04375 [Patescibacteria group bacterium]|nr:hypothetical protein [Patescibacteria group bacterium]
MSNPDAMTGPIPPSASGADAIRARLLAKRQAVLSRSAPGITDTSPRPAFHRATEQASHRVVLSNMRELIPRLVALERKPISERTTDPDRQALAEPAQQMQAVHQELLADILGGEVSQEQKERAKDSIDDLAGAIMHNYVDSQDSSLREESDRALEEALSAAQDALEIPRDQRLDSNSVLGAYMDRILDVPHTLEQGTDGTYQVVDAQEDMGALADDQDTRPSPAERSQSRSDPDITPVPRHTPLPRPRPEAGFVDHNAPTEETPAAERSRQHIVEVGHIRRLYDQVRREDARPEGMTQEQRRTVQRQIDTIHQAVVPGLMGMTSYEDMPQPIQKAFDNLTAVIAYYYLPEGKQTRDSDGRNSDTVIEHAYDAVKARYNQMRLGEGPRAGGEATSIQILGHNVRTFFTKRRMPSYKRFMQKFEREVIRKPHYLQESHGEYTRVPYPRVFKYDYFDPQVHGSLREEALHAYLRLPASEMTSNTRGLSKQDITNIALAIQHDRSLSDSSLFDSDINHVSVPHTVEDNLVVFTPKAIRTGLEKVEERGLREGTPPGSERMQGVGDEISALGQFLTFDASWKNVPTVAGVLDNVTFGPATSRNFDRNRPLLIAQTGATNPVRDPFLLLLPPHMQSETIIDIFAKRFPNLTIVPLTGDGNAAHSLTRFYVDSLTRLHTERFPEEPVGSAARVGLSRSEMPPETVIMESTIPGDSSIISFVNKPSQKAIIPAGSETGGWVGLFEGTKTSDAAAAEYAATFAQFSTEPLSTAATAEEKARAIRERVQTRWRYHSIGIKQFEGIRPTGTVAEVIDDGQIGVTRKRVRIERMPGSADMVYIRFTDGTVAPLTSLAEVEKDEYQRTRLPHAHKGKKAIARDLVEYTRVNLLTPEQATEVNILLESVVTPQDLDVLMLRLAGRELDKKLASPTLSPGARQRLLQKKNELERFGILTDGYYHGFNHEVYGSLVASLPVKERKKFEKDHPPQNYTGFSSGQISDFLGGLTTKERERIVKSLPPHLRELNQYYINRAYGYGAATRNKGTVLYQDVRPGEMIIIASSAIPPKIVANAAVRSSDPAEIAQTAVFVANQKVFQHDIAAVVLQA